MLRVIGCLGDNHDLVLLAVAACLCVLASLATLALLDARRRRPARRAAVLARPRRRGLRRRRLGDAFPRHAGL